MLELTLYKKRKIASNNRLYENSGSFVKIRKYYHMALKTNLGALAIVFSHMPLPNSVTCFKRCFKSFPTQKQGILTGCRAFIGIDGCFFKEP